MILTIRTDAPEATIGLYKGDGNEIASYSWLAARRLSNELLPQIKELLERNSGSWGDVEGIVAFEGPGSFTGLRIGLTTANTIAYSLGRPVIGSRGDDWVITGIRQLGVGKGAELALPHYGAEANITEPRH